jgi:hypothetical protein
VVVLTETEPEERRREEHKSLNHGGPLTSKGLSSENDVRSVSLPPSINLHCPFTCFTAHVSLSKIFAPRQTLVFSTHQSTQVRLGFEKNVCCCNEALNTKGSGLIEISPALRLYSVHILSKLDLIFKSKD